MTRAAVLLLVSSLTDGIAAQSGLLAFDAISIRENTTINDEGTISAPTRGRFTVSNLPVAALIRYAYGIRDYQLLDAPDWATATPYDIVATYPAELPVVTDAEIRQMVQALLADRFSLQVRREKRELPVLELRVARADGKPGPQLVPSTTDCGRPQAPTERFPPCQAFQTRSMFQGRGQTLDRLATALQAMIRLPVVNRTGLTGPYDVTLRWGDARGPAEQASVEEIAAMTTAIEEQLGLKLQSGRAPADVIVVTSVRRPTAN
jgi:uncharacterized protein (TIGR03435 family)